MMNFPKLKIVATLSQLAVLIFSAMVSQSVYAKWDEERDMTTNGKEELIYYYKTNDQGQKLVLDKYVKRLIFIRPDKFYKRSIKTSLAIPFLTTLSKQPLFLKIKMKCSKSSF
jgi:hypothetical protein